MDVINFEGHEPRILCTHPMSSFGGATTPFAEEILEHIETGECAIEL